MHAATPAFDVGRSDDICVLPVAAFYQNVGPHSSDELKRRVFVEPRHQAHGFERCDHRSSIFQVVYRAVIAFAEAPNGIVRIQGDDETRSERPCLREVNDVAAVEYVENTVRENERTRESVDALIDISWRAELGFEIGLAIHVCAPGKSHIRGVAVQL